MPEAMVRKQVYIERDQDARLKRYARALGVTEAELIRRGIDAVVPATTESYGRMLRETADATIESVRSVSLAERARGWTRDEIYGERPRYLAEKDLRSWERALALTREFVQRAAASSGEAATGERGWSREDAYAERLARLDD
jgi:hypothetical protein